GRENDLAATAGAAKFATLPPAHAHRALAIQFKSFDQTARFEAKVSPMQHRLEKTTRRRPAPAPLLVDVEITDAVVVACVRVLNGRNSILVCRFTKCVENFPGQARVLDAPLAARGVMIAFQEMIDVFTKVRPYVVPRPAGQTQLPPMIVVAGLAQHVNHAVDRRRTANHLSSRIIEAAAIQARLRLSLQQPISTRIADGEEIPDRNVKPDPVVFSACFQK